jgi:hypothetical protein
MKKTLLGFGLAGMALVLAGCGQQPVAVQNNSSDQGQPAAQTEQKDSSIVGSIKDAMGLNKQMKCTYSVKTGDSALSSAAYVDGQKYKGETIIAGKKMNSLFDGDAMYTWADGSTTGMKIPMACINDLKNSAPQGQSGASGAQSPEDKFKNATDVSCVPATDIDFSVPTAVTFTDQCAMMKKASEMMKNLPKGAVPGGVPNIPNY